MSYLALARKWRPRTFSQLLGQDHVSKGLINSLNQQRLHHAYLFTGTRGVGKTSIARLLAKALNCEQGVSSEPCLVCETCQSIEQGRFIDLIEVDAASKTGVDDTRALLENVQYATSGGRYKVYLIDEVHMLSQHSFNALLKTLEEPPEHVKFLLATTDPQKLPATVISRCLQFNLRPLSIELLSQHMAHILQEEKIDFDEDALSLIARAGKGSVRDSLSILDQVINGSDGRISGQSVKQLLGHTQHDYAKVLLQMLAEGHAQQLFSCCQQIAKEGGQFHYVLEALLEYLHQIALWQQIGNIEQVKDSPVEALAQQFNPEDIQLLYDIALKGQEELALAPAPAIGFEMTLLRMLVFRPAGEIQAQDFFLSEQVSQSVAEQNAVTTAPAKDIAASAAPMNTVQTATERAQPTTDAEELTENKEPVQSQKQPEKKIPQENNDANIVIKNSAPISNNWDEILPALGLKGLSHNAAENAILLEIEGSVLVLGVSGGHQSLFTPSTTQRIEEALSNYFQSPRKIRIEKKDQIENSPAQQKQMAKEQRHQAAEQSLEQDPVLEEIKQSFSAKIVNNSITAKEDGV